MKEIAGVATKTNPHQNTTKSIISDNIKVIRIVSPQGSKFAGIIAEDNGKKIFKKKVDPQVHFFRNLNAWGFQAELIDVFKSNNVEEIHVEDNSKKYVTNLFTLIRNGIYGDYGHGRQIFLPLKFWTETKMANNQLSLLGDESDE